MDDRVTIPIEAQTRDQLRALKQGGETYDELIKRVVDERDQLKYETEGHRLADAEPTSVPADAPRDDNNDPEEL